MDCIGFVVRRASVSKEAMSAQRGFGPLHHPKDVFSLSELKQCSFQISIEFPFFLHKRRTLCTQTSGGRKKKRSPAQSVLKYHGDDSGIYADKTLESPA